MLANKHFLIFCFFRSEFHHGKMCKIRTHTHEFCDSYYAVVVLISYFMCLSVTFLCQILFLCFAWFGVFSCLLLVKLTVFVFIAQKFSVHSLSEFVNGFTKVIIIIFHLCDISQFQNGIHSVWLSLLLLLPFMSVSLS